MNLLPTLAHWWWMAISPSYRRHVHELNNPVQPITPITPGTTIETLHGGQRVHGVHPRNSCLGYPCAVHNPGDHHMASWRQNWRGDRKIMERVCPHGIGHPDPDHMAFVLSRVGPVGEAESGVHGCDGCCAPPGESR